MSVLYNVKVRNEQQEDFQRWERFKTKLVLQQGMSAIHHKKQQEVEWPKADAPTDQEEARVKGAGFRPFFEGQPSEQKGGEHKEVVEPQKTGFQRHTHEMKFCRTGNLGTGGEKAMGQKNMEEPQKACGIEVLKIASAAWLSWRFHRSVQCAHRRVAACSATRNRRIPAPARGPTVRLLCPFR